MDGGGPACGAWAILFLLFLGCFASQGRGAAPPRGRAGVWRGASPWCGVALGLRYTRGSYGLWRFQFQILGALPVWCGDVLLILGALTALVGVVYALAQEQSPAPTG